MTVTIKDLKEQLSQYPDDMEVVITHLTGHNDYQGAGLYQPLDDFLENFNDEVKPLTSTEGTKDYLALNLSTYADDLFFTTDVETAVLKNMTAGEALDHYPEELVDKDFTLQPREIENNLSRAEQRLKALSAEIDELEREILIGRVEYDNPQYKQVTDEWHDAINAIRYLHKALNEF